MSDSESLKHFLKNLHFSYRRRRKPFNHRPGDEVLRGQATVEATSCCIRFCRHGNRRGCDLDQWPKSVTTSRAYCFATKFGRACTKSPRSWPRATLQFIRQYSRWRYAAGSSQTGDCLTLQVGTIRICSGKDCFAAILGDGSAVTRGSAHNGGDGGDSSSVHDQLKDPNLACGFCRHPDSWVCRHMGP